MTDTPEEKTQILEFPCSFPIKTMGRDDSGFREAAVAIVERHAGELPENAVRIAPSRTGKFVSVTITIEATSQEQLDKIYHELTAHDDVIMSL
jgi:putative lipoic acid-binding regulatory protein